MRASQTETIGKYRYTITQLGATQGRKVYRRLLSLVGSAAGGLEGTGEGAALKAIGKLVEHLSDEDLDFFCDTFAPMTTVAGGEYTKGAPILTEIYEEHFSGHMVDMTKWLLACFRVNFADFFAVLGQGGPAVEKVESALISQNTLTGGNGASSQAA